MHVATCFAHRLVHSENSSPLLSFRASQRGSKDQQLSHTSSHQHARQNYCQFRAAFVINPLIKGEIPTPVQLGLKRELRYISAVMSDVGIGLCALEDLFLFLLNLIDHDSLYSFCFMQFAQNFLLWKKFEV